MISSVCAIVVIRTELAISVGAASPLTGSTDRNINTNIITTHLI